ncbi:MAG: DUF1792 domain-containing protein [Candidatus Gastranaerophilales bacterium]|nr:DUF1792 domain-containing protein [Candidatus Gastranaerophilales bacterium]
MFRVVKSDKRVKFVIFNKLKISLKYNFISYFASIFTPPYRKSSAKRLESKKYDLIEVCRTLKMKEIFPKNILSIEDTISYVINNKASVSRIGDGEELGGNILGRDCHFPELKDKLTKIMKNGSNKNCLVCVNNFNADKEDLSLYWRRHFLNYWTNVVPPSVLQTLEFDNVGVYGDAYAFLFYFNGATSAEIKKRKRYIEQIWNNRKVLFVVNRDSKIVKDNECFSNVLLKDYIYGPEYNAYEKYYEIYEQIKNNYGTDWLIYIEMGAMATVLAYELSVLGYQALDMGHFYTRIYHHIDKTHLDCSKT